MSSSRVTAEDAAELVLIAHQRYDAGGCLCGWNELGRSHPAHQVAILREAGLLNDDAALWRVSRT